MNLIAVLNRDGGTFRTMELARFVDQTSELFAAAGHAIGVRLIPGGEVRAALEQAVADPAADGVVAGGGDGTISTAAAVCFRHDKPLGVVPAGTMNLFARSLGMPLDPLAAMGALAAAKIGSVDIATANGRPFVHQFAVGLHPRLIRLRNGLPYGGRWGKILASFRAVGEAVRRPLAFDVDVLTADAVLHRPATAVSISNNLLGEGHLPYAERLDGGTLGVYLVRPMPPGELVQLLLRLMGGRWKDHELVSEEQAGQVVLRFPHRKHDAHAVIDGELIPLDAEVDLRVHPGALKVLMPPG